MPERSTFELEFLENILRAMRISGIVVTQRGHVGGYALARSAADLAYPGAAAALGDVWIAMRQSMLAVLDSVTLADLASGELPAFMLEVDPATTLERAAREAGK